MKIKRIIMIALVLAVLTIGTASASQDLNETVLDDAGEIENTGFLNADGHDELSVVDEDEGDDEDYTEVSIEIPDIVEIGAGDSLVVQLPDDARGVLVVNVNGSHWKTFNNLNGEEDSDYEVNLDALGCGIFHVAANFTSSDGKYAPVSNSETVAVIYSIAIGIVEDPYIYAKQGNMVYVSAPEDILMAVDVRIDGKKYALTRLDETRAYIDISGFDGGSYTIVASFEGNSKYDEYSTNETIRIVSAIDAPQDNIVYNSEVYVILKLPEDAKGNLTLTVNGVLIDNVKVVNEQAKIKFPTSKVGRYFFNATYTGKDFTISKILNRYVEVVPKVNIPSQMTVGEDKYITFESDAEGIFVVEVDADPYDTVDSKSRVSLAHLDDGEFDISVTYYGAGDYIHYFDDVTLIVNSVPIRFAGAKDINMIYSDGTTYSVTIYGTNGRLLEEDEYVELKIGKKIFDAYTNSKGVVNFKIPNSVVPGKYQIMLIYDDEHVVKTSLVVKHILSLKKVNVKSSAKKLVLTASLKKVNNKYLKGKSVVFKFNGKKYVAKTDKKGVAKVTINNNVLKKLKSGKKVKYQAKYLKDTVKKSAIVKK